MRFPITGPLRYTMTARDAIELCGLVRPRVAIPIHYEGWAHFRDGRDAIEREFARAPDAVRRSLRWLPLGEAVEIEAPAGRRRPRRLEEYAAHPGMIIASYDISS